MAVRDIIRMGHPTLRKVAEPYPVDHIGSDSFEALLTDMRDTLHAVGGIGLAAPQIDISRQLAVIEITDSGSRYGDIPALPFSVFINPKITVVTETLAGYWEGCLSIPGMMGFVRRPQHLVVDYLDRQGSRQSMELQGFLATVLQHEFDHLEGRLYPDRIADLALFCFEAEYRAYHQHQDEHDQQ